MKIHSLLAGVLFVSALQVSQTAKAYSETRVTTYSSDQFRDCSRAVPLGAGVGILAGVTSSLLGANLGQSVAIGAGAGLVTGALSCEKKRTYVTRVDTHLNGWDSRRPIEYDQPGVRVNVIRSGYAANGAVCRTYQTEYEIEPGYWESEVQTACYDGIRRIWVHGYPESIFSRYSYEVQPRWVHVNVELERKRHNNWHVEYRRHYGRPYYRVDYWGGPAPRYEYRSPRPRYSPPYAVPEYRSPRHGWEEESRTQDNRNDRRDDRYEDRRGGSPSLS